MLYKVIGNFAMIREGTRYNCEAGGTVEINDERLLKECVEKNLIEIVPIMGTESTNDSVEFLNVEQLKKLRTKAKLIEYAESIGLESLDKDKSVDELISTISEYVDELQNSNIFDDEDDDLDGDDE